MKFDNMIFLKILTLLNMLIHQKKFINYSHMKNYLIHIVFMKI
jgi:hypothetical protein